MSVTTGSDGTFTIPGVEDGSFTLTTTLSGFIFKPASRAVTVSGADVGRLDFEASLLALQLGAISAGTAEPVTVGSSVTFEATFSDLGESGLLSATWDWEDGPGRLRPGLGCLRRAATRRRRPADAPDYAYAVTTRCRQKWEG